MSTAFWRKVSTKSLASRSLKRPRILLPGEESENLIKEESRASRWNSKADIAPGPSQVKFVLNEFFRFPRKSPAPPVVPNFAASLRSFGTTGNNSVASDWPLTRRNVDGEMTLRWKSAQSSCEKDSQNSRESRKCIEDHRQSAEICEKAREKCADDNRVSAEDYRESCCEDSPKSHRECHRSIESGPLGYSDTPVVPYSDWRASESTKHNFRGATRITCRSWTRGKLATEGKIYHKCKPKPCTYPHGRKKTIRSALYSPEDCSEEQSNLRKVPEEAATADPSCSRAKSKSPSCVKALESEMPSAGSMPIIDEYAEKPDPPPPRYPHWTENPPSYCDHCSKTALDTPTVKSSPMIFIPKKEPRRSRVKDTAPSLRDVPQSKSECGKADVEARISPCASSSQLRESLMTKYISPHCGIPFKDKCADSLTLPAPVDKTEQKIQWFPTLTREGRCHAAKPGKKFAMSDVSDCKPNVASFKYRLSKCPCSSGIHNPDVDRKSSDDVGIRQRQDDPLCRDKETNELESRRETAKGRGKRVKLRTRQRYKVRLKMLRKGDKRPDPSRIAELGQPCDGRTRSPLSKEVRSVTEDDELSPRLRNSCSDYCPPERPVEEHKSYATKMEESRAKSRGQSQEKCPYTKRR